MNTELSTRESFFTKDTLFYKTLFGLILTITLQNLIAYSVNMLDNIMLGSYSQNALSGAATVNQVFFMVQQTALPIGNALVALASQYWGQKQTQPIRELTGIALKFCLLVSVLVMVVCTVFPVQLLRIFTTSDEIIAEGLAARERNQKIRLNRLEEINRLLELVGLNSSYANRYPHELSGGQLQRVCIARAVACQPEIILFDEAISSLDAHTQIQIMDLLHDLKEKLGLTYIFITHDLTSVTYFCDDVMFLYRGRVTEHLPVSRIADTKDPYARRLLDSIIDFEEDDCHEAV